MSRLGFLVVLVVVAVAVAVAVVVVLLLLRLLQLLRPLLPPLPLHEIPLPPVSGAHFSRRYTPPPLNHHSLSPEDAPCIPPGGFVLLAVEAANPNSKHK